MLRAATVLFSARLASAGLALVAAMPTTAEAGDWEVQRDPFDAAVVGRYKAILAKSPHDAGALAQLVSLYRRHRTVEKLAADYRAAPETWSSLVVLALIERRLGDDTSARVRLERAVALHGTDVPTWRLLAQLREQAADRIGAREALERAYAHSTPEHDAQVLRDLVAFAQRSSDHESEERYYTQLVVVLPRDVRVWTERGDAMARAGRFDLARESYDAAEKLLATDPEERVSVIVRRARVYEKLGRTDDAMRELHRALAMVPRESYAVREIVMQIVQARRAAGALPLAIVELEAMWPPKSRKHFEWTLLASLYEETKDLPRAIDALRAAVARSPTETITQLRLVELLDRTHAQHEALERMEAIARRQPRDVALQLSLARRYGFFDDRAIDTLVALARRSAKDPETLMSIAQLYLEWHRDDLAEAELAKILALTEASKDPAALAALGARALELGTYKAALASYKAALALAPRDPALWTGAAFAHDGLRNWDEAFEALETALHLVPDDVARRDERRAARKNLVQLLFRTRAVTRDYIDAYHQMWAWSFEQDDDLDAGYFLALFYAASPRDDQPYKTLARLHQLVPDDKEIERELALARRLARPLDASGPIHDPFPDDEWISPTRSDSLEGRRIGLHVGVGPGIRDMPLSFVLGTSFTFRVARRLSIDTRIDWTHRVGDQGSTTAVATSLGIAAHVYTNQQVALLVGAAQRIEARYAGDLMATGWRRFEGGNDLTTSLVLRDAPFVVGTRVEALYSGRVNALLELAFEWR